MATPGHGESDKPYSLTPSRPKVTDILDDLDIPERAARKGRPIDCQLALHTALREDPMERQRPHGYLGLYVAAIR